MAERYVYSLYYQDGLGDNIAPFDILNNKIKHAHYIHHKYKGMELSTFEGSFCIEGSNFDRFTACNRNGHYVQLWIEDTALAPRKYVLYLEEVLDVDYDQRVCEIKILENQWLHNSFMSNLEKSFSIGYGGTVLYDSGGVNYVTNYSYKVGTWLEDLFYYNFAEVFEYANAWFDDPPVSYGGFLDLDELRFFSMRYLIKDGISELLGGSDYQMTLDKYFLILQDLFKVFMWFDYDEQQVKFKIPKDLVTNILDVTTLTGHMNKKSYDKDKFALTETLRFSQNNELDADIDWINHFILYNRSNKALIYDHNDITTYWKLNGDYKSDGMFLCMASKVANYMQPKTGFASSSIKENGELATINILDQFHRDHILTNRNDSVFSDLYTIGTPTHFSDLIKYPDIEMVIPDFSVFYNGLRWKVDGTNEIIVRVTRQETDLATNLTKFSGYEFKNNIN